MLFRYLQASVSALGGKSGAAVEGCADISKLDLRVGRITDDVKKHPDADRCEVTKWCSSAYICDILVYRKRS